MNQNSVLLILCLLMVSCHDPIEIEKYFTYILQKTEPHEIIEYQNIPEDSIFYVTSEMIPPFIYETLDSYPHNEALSDELRNSYQLDTDYIKGEVLMMLFHMSLNEKELTNKNLIKHWKSYVETNKELRRQDSLKLNQFVQRNYNNFQIGDQVKLILEVETVDENFRTMTYGSVYDMYNSNRSFIDSLIIQGEILRKGEYPKFDTDEFSSFIHNSPMFEIRMNEISDTSVSIKFTGPTEDLKIGELFYIDLEGYGCRDIIKMEGN